MFGLESIISQQKSCFSEFCESFLIISNPFQGIFYFESIVNKFLPVLASAAFLMDIPLYPVHCTSSGEFLESPVHLDGEHNNLLKGSTHPKYGCHIGINSHVKCVV